MTVGQPIDVPFRSLFVREKQGRLKVEELLQSFRGVLDSG